MATQRGSFIIQLHFNVDNQISPEPKTWKFIHYLSAHTCTHTYMHSSSFANKSKKIMLTLVYKAFKSDGKKASAVDLMNLETMERQTGNKQIKSQCGNLYYNRNYFSILKECL